MSSYTPKVWGGEAWLVRVVWILARIGVNGKCILGRSDPSAEDVPVCTDLQFMTGPHPDDCIDESRYTSLRYVSTQMHTQSYIRIHIHTATHAIVIIHPASRMW